MVCEKFRVGFKERLGVICMLLVFETIGWAPWGVDRRVRTEPGGFGSTEERSGVSGGEAVGLWWVESIRCGGFPGGPE